MVEQNANNGSGTTGKSLSTTANYWSSTGGSCETVVQILKMKCVLNTILSGSMKTFGTLYKDIIIKGTLVPLTSW